MTPRYFNSIVGTDHANKEEEPSCTHAPESGPYRNNIPDILNAAGLRVECVEVGMYRGE